MRYFFGVLAIVVVTIIALVLLMSRPNSNQQGKLGAKRTVVLTDYADTDASVSLTIDGAINALENHRSIRIMISRNSRSITVYRGYNGDVLDNKVYSNTQDAYNAFLHALAFGGFSKDQKGQFNSSTGVCPLGLRYTYDLQDGSQELVNTWSTSCSSRQGTFAGNAQLTRQLFQAQIPNYNKLTGSVVLTSQ